MLNMLFGINKTFDIVLITVIAILLISCFKYKIFRIILVVVLYFCLLGTGIMSYIGIDRYYNASGGIWGQITGVTKPNQVEKTTDLTFNFKDIVLTEYGEPDSTGKINTYQAKFLSPDVVDINSDSSYALLVNDVPLDIDEFSSDYLIANFEYNFYDENMQISLNDTLKFRFAFYKNSTTFIVQTDGGTTAVNKWNNYFKKNSFIVRLVSTDKKENFFADNFVKLDFIFEVSDDVKLEKFAYILKGSKFNETISFDHYKYTVDYWTLNGEKIDFETYVFEENKTLVATLKLREFTLTLFGYKNPMCNTYDLPSNLFKTYTYGVVFNFEDIDTPTHDDFIFKGYSTTNTTTETSDTKYIKDGIFKIESNATLYCIWENKMSKQDVLKLIVGGLTDKSRTFLNGGECPFVIPGDAKISSFVKKAPSGFSTKTVFTFMSDKDIVLKDDIVFKKLEIEIVETISNKSLVIESLLKFERLFTRDYIVSTLKSIDLNKITVTTNLRTYVGGFYE